MHSGALGWVAFISFGAIYCMVPWLWNRELYSLRLVNWHFWIATIGIVFYITSMWVAGILQGLMWRAYTELGFLEYSFVETVQAMHPIYVIRALGGVLVPGRRADHGFNIWRTDLLAREAPSCGRPRSWRRRNRRGSPNVRSLWQKHAIFESNSICLLIGILIVIAIGGLVEIVPLFYLKNTIEKR